MLSTLQAPADSKLFKNCETAYRLIRNGKEAEARKAFPLEAYLVKKYVSLGLSEFRQLLASRLQLL